MGPTHLPQLQDSSLGSIAKAKTLNRFRCPIRCAWRIVRDLSVNTKSAKYYQPIQVIDRVELFFGRDLKEKNDQTSDQDKSDYRFVIKS